MATSDGPELDLYADDIGDELTQEYPENDNDLYDDVLTSNSTSSSATKRNQNSKSTKNEADDDNNNDKDDEQQKQMNGSENNSNSNQTNSGSSQNHSFSTNNQSSNDNLNHYPSSTNNSVRRPSLYVGNLTWWTTDEDIIKAFSTININDVVEVKFFENRANGQSKGFCTVYFQSEQSVRLALEKMKQTSIHNQTPLVTLCNRQNLNNFELKAGRKPGMNGQPSAGNTGTTTNNSTTGGIANQPPQQLQQANNQHHQNSFLLQNNRNFNQHGPNQMHQPTSHRPPLIPRPSRPNAPLLSHHSNPSAVGHTQPRLPMPHPTLSFGNASSSLTGAGSTSSGNHHHQSWNNHLMSNSSRNNPLQSANANPLNAMMRLNQGSHRSMTNQPLLSAPGTPSSIDLRSQLSSGSLPGVHGQITPAQAALLASQPALNLPSGTNDLISNRLSSLGSVGFGQAAAGAHSMYGDRSLDPLSSMGHHHHDRMSEAEFEEILNKNKSLANTVISQAVSDAALGDYTGAIEKLSTAISLMEGSRVSNDERCKIIISTMQDTLHSIKQRAYSSGGGGSRNRSDHRMMRSRSRDRDEHRGGSSSHRSSGGRDRDQRDRGRSGRDRSRSRERDYRERSRDRYHEDHRSHNEDRYRDRDRDRDHRGRH